ncbi:MAG: MarR family winged helix-turn-helix transcriptional regulator [Novosphingobium sp.]|jgi:DNA-binding MarR family transcriptional regulator|uniref:MarR family winged helix-turn-helix transcriptional regulator n=1 Tax=Novosphingobium sp. TaxID=1874826 RepID=UPI00391CB69F|nr:MarR family winged helix-turn-helix transcriptional regulator [Novosphingobium sp.]
MTQDTSRLADFLPYLLSVTTNAVSDMIASEYRARFGLKIPEWRVMAVLGDAGPQTQRSLVGATRMDKVAVNRACKVLVDRGLVTRSPNADDGRSHHIELTAAGRAVHGEIMPLALEMERRLFASLSAAERKDFKALLARITARVAELEGTAEPKELTR